MTSKIPANKYIDPTKLKAVLQEALNLNLNVALIGKHGVGKTSLIKDVLTSNNITFLYFSGSTLDPWIDFVGIPVKGTDANNEAIIEYLRPKELINPNLEVIVIDEFNRAPKKVRNAVLELLQFKSINGRKFPKLKCVWTGINPSEEGDYDVEDLDPAQLDRFELHIHVAYKPDSKYFSNKYSFGRELIDFWSTQSDEVKKEITPRRLDYIGEAINKQVTPILLASILPKSININTIESLLKLNDSKKKELLSKTEEEFKQIVSNEKTLQIYFDTLLNDVNLFTKAKPFLSEELLRAKVNKASEEVQKLINTHLSPSNNNNPLNNANNEISMYFSCIPLVQPSLLRLNMPLRRLNKIFYKQNNTPETAKNIINYLKNISYNRNTIYLGLIYGAIQNNNAIKAELVYYLTIALLIYIKSDKDFINNNTTDASTSITEIINIAIDSNVVISSVINDICDKFKFPQLEAQLKSIVTKANPQYKI